MPQAWHFMIGSLSPHFTPSSAGHAPAARGEGQPAEHHQGARRASVWFQCFNMEGMCEMSRDWGEHRLPELEEWRRGAMPCSWGIPYSSHFGDFSSVQISREWVMWRPGPVSWPLHQASRNILTKATLLPVASDYPDLRALRTEKSILLMVFSVSSARNAGGCL